MARRRDRIVAIILTVLFFVTSFGLSFVVIWQLYKDNKEAKTVNDGTVNSQSTKPTPAQQTPAKTGNDKLEGTQLQNFTPVSTVNDLQVIDTQPGTGDEVKAHDTVTVDYTGAVAATGTIFQSSLDMGQAVTLSLDGVIKGWSEGMVGMKVGGVRRLLIPAAQAYGANPPSGIPVNANLVFDITLKSIGAGQ